MHENISIDPAIKNLDTTQEDEFQPVNSHISLNQDQCVFPALETAAKTPVTTHTEPSDTPSGSIWNQPLQNLGDFATLVMPLAMEQSEMAQPFGTASTGTPPLHSEWTEVALRAEDEFANKSEPQRAGVANDPGVELLPAGSKLRDFAPTQTPYFIPNTGLSEQEKKPDIPDIDDVLKP